MLLKKTHPGAIRGCRGGGVETVGAKKETPFLHFEAAASSPRQQLVKHHAIHGWKNSRWKRRLARLLARVNQTNSQPATNRCQPERESE
jgi:hypothetical protein